MLAVPMPPPVSTSDTNRPSHSMTSTLSPPPSCQPALSPSNVPCGLTSDQKNSVPPRPKLTLQTRCLPRTSGTSSTGLSVFASGASASPTVRNTFKNAYDVPLPASATTSPSKTPKLSKPASPYATSNLASPYQLPLGVRSILRNSPLDPSSRRLSVSIAPSAVSGGSAPRRVFFPAKKQVNYRTPLEEEIRTVHYTARHSDLVAEPDPEPLGDSGSDNDSDSNSNSSSEPSDSGGSEDDISAGRQGSSLGKLERKKRKQLSAQRQIRAVALLDGFEDDAYASSTPQTPQDRVKRRREWKWTLGPIERRNETFGFSHPSKPEFNPSPAASAVSLESESKAAESPVSFDSDRTCFSTASRPVSSPGSSAASPGYFDESKTTMIRH